MNGCVRIKPAAAAQFYGLESFRRSAARFATVTLRGKEDVSARATLAAIQHRIVGGAGRIEFGMNGFSIGHGFLRRDATTDLSSASILAS